MNIHTDDWHEKRREGIGGSDASIVMGVSPFSSRLELWTTKVEGFKIDNTDNKPYLDWGNLLEPLIIQRYCNITKRKVFTDITFDKRFECMIGNVDGVVESSNRKERGILEIKTKNAFAHWEKDWKEGNVPLYYKMQLQHYLAVSGYSWGSFAILDLGSMELIWFDVERDNDLINHLIKEEQDFWYTVVNKIKPEPDSSKVCNDFLRSYYPESVKDTFIDLTGVEEAIEQSDILIQSKKLAKSVKESEMGAKNYFMDLMGDNEKAFGDDFSISWKSMGNKESFDIKSFKDKHPELYYEFITLKPQTRRFSFREKIN